MTSYGDYAIQSGRLWVVARLREMALQSKAEIWGFNWTATGGKHELAVRSKAGTHSTVVEDRVLRRVLDTFAMRRPVEARLRSLLDEVVVAKRRGPG